MTEALRSELLAPSIDERRWLMRDLKKTLGVLGPRIAENGIFYDHEALTMYAKLTSSSSDLNPILTKHLRRELAANLELVAPRRPKPYHGYRWLMGRLVRSELRDLRNYYPENHAYPPVWQVAISDMLKLGRYAFQAVKMEAYSANLSAEDIRGMLDENLGD